MQHDYYDTVVCEYVRRVKNIRSIIDTSMFVLLAADDDAANLDCALVFKFSAAPATHLWYLWQGGTSESSDFVYAVSAGADGSFFLGGNTYGSWGGVTEGELDFLALKLSSAGELLWVWQVGERGGYAVTGY